MKTLACCLIATTIASVAVLVACSDDSTNSPPTNTNDGGPEQDGLASSTSSSGASSTSSSGSAVDPTVVPTTPPTAAWALTFPASSSSFVAAVASTGTDFIAVGQWRGNKNPFNDDAFAGSDGVNFVAKIAAAGTLTWSHSFTTTPTNGGGFQHIAVAPDGSSYVTGVVPAAGSLDLGSVVLQPGPFIVKLDPTGAAVWSHSFPASTSTLVHNPRAIVADANGATMGMHLFGAAAMDGQPIAALGTTAKTEIAFLRFGAADGALAAAESFVATSGGGELVNLTQLANGDLAFGGGPGQDMKIGTTAAANGAQKLGSSSSFWTLLPKGQKEPKWVGLGVSSFTAAFAIAPDGTGVGVTTYEKSFTFGGKAFPQATNAIAIGGVNPADGTMSWGRALVFTNGNTLTTPRVHESVATNGAFAFRAETDGVEVDVGGGPIKGQFVWWGSTDGTPLHSFLVPESMAMAFDSSKSLLVSGYVTSAMDIGGKQASGLYFLKLNP